MKKMEMLCWIETNRRLQKRMAMRIASLPRERWTSKIIDYREKDTKTTSMNS